MYRSWGQVIHRPFNHTISIPLLFIYESINNGHEYSHYYVTYSLEVFAEGYFGLWDRVALYAFFPPRLYLFSFSFFTFLCFRICNSRFHLRFRSGLPLLAFTFLAIWLNAEAVIMDVVGVAGKGGYSPSGGRWDYRGQMCSYVLVLQRGRGQIGIRDDG